MVVSLVAGLPPLRFLHVGDTVSRRGGAPWAPTPPPALRRQWCHVLEEGLERTREGGGVPTEILAQAGQDLAGVERSRLYWVVREMVDLAVGAAASLPEWSPAAAIPTEYGLMCFAKPIGTFDWAVPGGSERVRMPVDAMGWGIREDAVGVSCAFRTERIAEQLHPGLARLPLLSHTVGAWNMEQPVGHRLEDGAVSPLSVLGTCWLLMDQPSVSASREIRTATAGYGGDGDVQDGTEAVSVIELRRLRSGDSVGAQGRAGRKINKRFLVSGRWLCKGGHCLEVAYALAGVAGSLHSRASAATFGAAESAGRDQRGEHQQVA